MEISLIYHEILPDYEEMPNPTLWGLPMRMGSFRWKFSLFIMKVYQIMKMPNTTLWGLSMKMAALHGNFPPTLWGLSMRMAALHGNFPYLS
jgi:hypothetical protein